MALILSGVAYGILEVFLLHLLLKSALSGNLKKTILPLFIKLMSYGAALLLIYFFFLDSVKFLAIGYTIGVIVSIPLILLFSKRKSEKTKKQISSEGDDK
jgi:membrane protein CcdC involved in cytochrome C biogenesis